MKVNREEGNRLRIGEVAARSGLSRDTIRYYERLGLLPRPMRTLSGYRLYETRVVERLGFIKRAQSFGFTLDQVKQLLSLDRADPQTCSQVIKMIEGKLEELGRRYQEIQRLRRELSVYKTECERAIANVNPAPSLRILFALGGASITKVK
ncbi:MAG TPA: MerR family DNA-binding protein [Blastocatellia bacterium]|nr:MerR family DNA-binding protein [Blastocatellia bacterium]